MTTERQIYFAGSIRGGRDDQRYYSEIIAELGKYGTVLTEHVGRSGLSSDGDKLRDRQIHARDIKWLKQSDCLVAEVTTPSLGVGYEIGKASEWEKPILCLFRPRVGRSLSAMIAGCLGITLREYRTTTEINTILKNYFRAL